MEKQDMSKTCGLKDVEMWIKRSNNEITEEEFQAWYHNNCAKCSYESEICMYGEE